jgi:hypothetical protein
MSSGCNTCVGAHFKSDGPFWGRAFLEHGADGVNDFLVQPGAAIISLRPSGVSMAPAYDNARAGAP